MFERVTLAMLVGGILFEIVTGVLNIQYDYIFGFSFYTAHYFGAWVFIAGFVCSCVLEAAENGQRACGLCPMRSVLAHLGGRYRAGAPDPDGLVAVDPDPPTDESGAGPWPSSAGARCWSPCSPPGKRSADFARGAALLLPRGRS